MTGRKPLALKILDVAAALCVIVAAGLVFFYAPLEAVMGQVQRVFYFHVAAAWTGMLSFLAAAVCGVGYLRSSRRLWDTASLAAVEIGVVFLLVAVISGSIWARPVWNTWWTWDPRLTTVTIMLLIYAAYLLLRKGIDDPGRRARFGAVYAIIGFVSVPLTFFSIRLLRTIHPVIIGSSGSSAAGAFAMSPRMLHTFLFSLAAFSVLFADLLWHRIRLGLLADQVARRRDSMED